MKGVILFIVPAIIMYCGCLFSYKMGQRTAFSRNEKGELNNLRDQRNRIFRLAAQYAATEPFALIVMDELNKMEKED